MIRQGADVEDVKGHIGAPGLDVHNPALAEGVTDAKFVIDIGVINAQVADAQVGEQQLLEHICQDVT